MSKKKKKKSGKKASKSTKRTPYAAITIVVPVDISAADKQVLEGVAQMLVGLGTDFSQVSIVNSNQISPAAAGELKDNEMSAMVTCPA
jgi:hypothetical protein